MKILAIHTGNNPDNAVHAVDLWRITRPINELKEHTDWQIDERPTIMKHFEKYKDAKDFTEEELQATVDDLKQYDVIWGSYTSFMHGMVFALCSMVADKYGVKFVLDIDDNMFAINPDNIGWWLKMSHEKTHELQTIIRNAKYVTTTNEALANVLRERLDAKVKVVPNFISKYHPECTPDNGDKIKIGYFGGASHFNDLHKTGMLPALQRIMHEHKNVYFESAGMTIEYYLPKKRYYYNPGARGWAWTNEIFPNLNFDIALGPLTDAIFNKSKSDIKWQESTRLGAAFIGSNIRPYAETVKHGVDGLIVENTEEDWYKALKKLVEDETYRKKLVTNARKRLDKEFALEKNWHVLKEALEDLCTA
jgi:glycosyltransferase involved in cell wall biosynthesis